MRERAYEILRGREDWIEVFKGRFLAETEAKALDALAAAYARAAKAVRKAIDEAAKAGDADTSDLFTGVSRGLDKGLWLLEAHLQADR